MEGRFLEQELLPDQHRRRSDRSDKEVHRKPGRKMKANKAYKFRLYPDAEQRVLFAKTFGCARFVYNRMLKDKIEYYQSTGKMLHNTPAPLKEEFPWLMEVDSLALANAQLQLQTAYKNFFREKSIGFPKFRSKKSGRKSYTTNNQKGTIRMEGGKLRLPKVGFVRMKQHREIPEGYSIKSVTILQDPSGKYYASILTEYERVDLNVILDADNAVGLDYSSPHFYVASDGEKADTPQFYREAEKKLAREQRKLSRMTKGGSNWKKQKIKVARAHEKVRFQRKDWQHKKSAELAEKYDYICVEDINLKGMAQSLNLAKATNDNGFGQFREFLSYKLAERGKKLITIDKWFPSSIVCHCCGYVNEELTLATREWTCPCCGEHHDRDINAAINIREQGLSLIA